MNNILHGVPLSPFVRKVRCLCAEKNIPYSLEPVLPFNMSDEFKKISPLAKIPVFQQDDFTLADSSVICAYLEKQYPDTSLYPQNNKDYAQALWLEEYADSAMVNAIASKVFLQTIIMPKLLKKEGDQELIKQGLEVEIPKICSYLSEQLADNNYFVANTFTIADIAITSQFVNLYHTEYCIDADRWPNLAKYYDKMIARPSFSFCLEAENQFLASL